MRPALLCMVKTNFHDHVLYRMRLDELGALARAAGYEPVGEVVQVMRKEGANYVFGTGKADELKNTLKAKGADLVIFYNVLSSSQKYNLEKRLEVRAIDRYDLTLEIFEAAANDELARLQIRWARLAKDLPYRRRAASTKFKLGRERPSFMSLGEYAYHGALKSLTRELKLVERKIEKQRAIRAAQRVKRWRLGAPTVCITGYYSAGKTSLFNALTKLRRPVGEKPFTTLTSKYYLVTRSNRGFLLVDTIGFVHDLDPRLIQAFQLTLEDVVSADLVLLVLDVSDPEFTMRVRLKSCLQIVRGLGVPPERITLVLNKVDRLKPKEIEVKLQVVDAYRETIPYVLVSAKEGINLNDLLGIVEKRLWQGTDGSPQAQTATSAA
ncbi:MAG: GTPase [Candidatus Bathyarchaeia archaeon]